MYILPVHIYNKNEIGSCCGYELCADSSCCGQFNVPDTIENSLNSMETRHRSTLSYDEASKKSSQRQREINEKNTGKKMSSKFGSLKLFLLIIVFGTILTFLFSPIVHTNRVSNSSTGSGQEVQQTEHVSISDSRYVSHISLNWTRISRLMEIVLNGKQKRINSGLLNFNISEVKYWKTHFSHAETSIIGLENAQKNVTWKDLYPEWIDEEEEYSKIPICPNLPNPVYNVRSGFDLIVVKLPCNKRLSSWSRDVARLHLQLAAAKAAVARVEKKYKCYVLFVSNCFPIPNLFACKNLVAREGDYWLYTPDLSVLREKVLLPVGSCQLAVPYKAKDRPISNARKHREAYATILHSATDYVCGAITAAQSILMSGSTRDLIILVDDTISNHHRKGLEASGWKVRTIKRIRNPKAEPDAYNEWNYSKFRLWQLTDYDKIIFIDADLLILRNIDILFAMPEITATGNNATLFNSGVMVLEPSACTFNLLMENINEIESYNGGDQGYLNEVFIWWHRMPKRMNYLKNFWVGDEDEVKEKKVRLFGADPPELYVLHYLGLKPWLCFRDYDCNWNVDIMQEFASDVAHDRWWKVHDKMPKKLQSYCFLRSRQKAALEWYRRQAEKGNFTDMHWKRKIKDKRLRICNQNFCNWESMLRHWGETNTKDNKKEITVKSKRGLLSCGNI